MGNEKKGGSGNPAGPREPKAPPIDPAKVHRHEEVHGQFPHIKNPHPEKNKSAV